MTIVQPISARSIGTFAERPGSLPLQDWTLQLNDSPDAKALQDAADRLIKSDVPVAFPTETVYGLGADATRSEAVKGIFDAKRRPSDNPLIIHVASIAQLERLSAIPDIYLPLIKRYWPGPLTILLPLAPDSPLAPEVTAGQSTFGVRMPRHLLALALIKLADVPIAAPSANASTRPSPTAAEHVLHDLDGRLDMIIDGGPCDIGLESTVVDGLSNPPMVLRPGGLSLDEIRSCRGFEHTMVGYADTSSRDGSAPRAPGMKYRHYAPRAKVVLIDPGQALPASGRNIGIVRTRSSPARPVCGDPSRESTGTLQDMLDESAHAPAIAHETSTGGYEMCIGPDDRSIARGLFSALRDLDRLNVDVIMVEGIDPTQGDIAAAIMNRLRKAAEEAVK